MYVGVYYWIAIALAQSTLTTSVSSTTTTKTTMAVTYQSYANSFPTDGTLLQCGNKSPTGGFAVTENANCWCRMANGTTYCAPSTVYTGFYMNTVVSFINRTASLYITACAFDPISRRWTKSSLVPPECVEVLGICDPEKSKTTLCCAKTGCLACTDHANCDTIPPSTTTTTIPTATKPTNITSSSTDSIVTSRLNTSTLTTSGDDRYVTLTTRVENSSTLSSTTSVSSITTSSSTPPTTTAPVVAPSTTTTEPLESAVEPSSGETPAWVYGVASGVATLLVGGAVALLVCLLKRRRSVDIEEQPRVASVSTRTDIYGPIQSIDSNTKGGAQYDEVPSFVSSEYGGLPPLSTTSTNYAKAADLPVPTTGSQYAASANMFVDINSLDAEHARRK